MVKAKEKTSNPFLNWALFAIFLIALFFVSYYIFSGIGKVEYDNLVFTKDKFGSIDIYRYTYSFNSQLLHRTLTYNFYTRTNPAENDVPYNNMTIVLPPEGSTIFLAYDEDNLIECNENTTLALRGLDQFLVSNQFKLSAGVINETNAIETNRTHMDCGIYPLNMTIRIAKGETTEISKLSTSICYTIEYKDCSELLPAVEKFEVRAIVDAKNRARR